MKNTADVIKSLVDRLNTSRYAVRDNEAFDLLCEHSLVAYNLRQTHPFADAEFTDQVEELTPGMLWFTCAFVEPNQDGTTNIVERFKVVVPVKTIFGENS